MKETVSPQTTIDKFIERLMALGEVEREIIAVDPRLRAEIVFQAVALTLCPLCFGYAVFNVALSLLGYSIPAALGLAVVAAVNLVTIDRHFLVQARGNNSDSIKKSIFKVRLLSVTIIAFSFMLMGTHTFRMDIDRELGHKKALVREALEQSTRFETELTDARAAVTSAGQAVRRQEEMRAIIVRLQVEKARAIEGLRNELEGNVSKGHTSAAGRGGKARGFEAAANRLGIEIDAATHELAQLEHASERLAAARTRLAEVESKVDEEATLAVAGAFEKPAVLWQMLKSNPSASIVFIFWILLGCLPDMLLYVAQRRMFNDARFQEMCDAENIATQARIQHVRSNLRQQQSDKLAPIEVRLESTNQTKPGNNHAIETGRLIQNVLVKESA